MLLLVALVVSCISVQAGKLPVFNDPFHGVLIVSRKNPPFLTLKAHPNRAYYVPTDQQLKEIRNAVYSNSPRSKRSSNDSINFDSYIGTKSARGPARMVLKLAGDDFEEDDLDLAPEEFEEGMERYALYAKFIGKMIIDMYKGYFTIDPQAPDLPFTSSNEKTYFKATVVPLKKMALWHEDAYASLKLHGKNRPYFPVEKISHELRECRSVGYTEVTDKDFQFKSKKGGIMTYYKVKCMKIKSNVFVFFALNDNDFTLKSNPSENTADDSCFVCSSQSGSKNDMFQQNRHLSAAQQKELTDYLIERVIKLILTDYQNKIQMAEGETENKPEIKPEPCDLGCDAE